MEYEGSCWKECVFVGRERARREFHYEGRSERRVRDVSMVV